MSDWKSCAAPPTKPGQYLVECRFPDGELLCGPELLHWDGDWIGSFGLQIMPHDVWREIDGGVE